jgi:hypothetical protein
VDIWEPEPPGTLRACPGLYRDCFALYVPILKGQDVFLDIVTFEGGTNALSQKSLIYYHRRCAAIQKMHLTET